MDLKIEEKDELEFDIETTRQGAKSMLMSISGIVANIMHYEEQKAHPDKNKIEYYKDLGGGLVLKYQTFSNLSDSDAIVLRKRDSVILRELSRCDDNDCCEKVLEKYKHILEEYANL